MSQDPIANFFGGFGFGGLGFGGGFGGGFGDSGCVVFRPCPVDRVSDGAYLTPVPSRFSNSSMMGSFGGGVSMSQSSRSFMGANGKRVTITE